jgi:hypothetical protein
LTVGTLAPNKLVVNVKNAQIVNNGTRSKSPEQLASARSPVGASVETPCRHTASALKMQSIKFREYAIRPMKAILAADRKYRKKIDTARKSDAARQPSKKLRRKRRQFKGKAKGHPVSAQAEVVSGLLPVKDLQVIAPAPEVHALQVNAPDADVPTLQIIAPAAEVSALQVNAPAADPAIIQVNAPAAEVPTLQIIAPAAEVSALQVNAPAAEVPTLQIIAPAAEVSALQVDAPAAEVSALQVNAPAAEVPTLQIIAPGPGAPALPSITEPVDSFHLSTLGNNSSNLSRSCTKRCCHSCSHHGIY